MNSETTQISWVFRSATVSVLFKIKHVEECTGFHLPMSHGAVSTTHRTGLTVRVFFTLFSVFGCCRGFWESETRPRKLIWTCSNTVDIETDRSRAEFVCTFIETQNTRTRCMNGFSKLKNAHLYDPGMRMAVIRETKKSRLRGISSDLARRRYFV